MIIVIADDFSGSAEVAGIGLRFGLSVEVQTNFNPAATSQLVIIDSHTRSINQVLAERKVKSIALAIKKVKIEWLYKKMDSLLRGNIIAEAKSLIAILPQKNILLIPANPGMGRIISGGKYYINGTPIHKSDFLMDPDYPRNTENVLELLDISCPDSVHILNPKNMHSIDNIVIGEAVSYQDLITWTKRLTPQIIPAGGSEFFSVILKSKGMKVTEIKSDDISLSNRKKFIVSGSLFPKRLRFLKDLREKISRIAIIPYTLNDKNDNAIQKCRDFIINTYEKSNFVFLFMDQGLSSISAREEVITKSLARITADILNAIPVAELIIEGGDTASTIVRQMHWKSLIPEREWSPGVVRMRVPGRPNLHLTTKPGSYPWPQELIDSWTY